MSIDWDSEQTKLFVQYRKRRGREDSLRAIYNSATWVTCVQGEHPQIPGGELDRTAHKVVEDSKLESPGPQAHGVCLPPLSNR